MRFFTNAAGCGSTLKEYDELLENDPAYAGKAHEFVSKMKDVSLSFWRASSSITDMKPVPYTVTYQDSCHLGARPEDQDSTSSVACAPSPGWSSKRCRCRICVAAARASITWLRTRCRWRSWIQKMRYVNMVNPDVIVTANPGCMLQLRAGAKLHGKVSR